MGCLSSKEPTSVKAKGKTFRKGEEMAKAKIMIMGN